MRIHGGLHDASGEMVVGKVGTTIADIQRCNKANRFLPGRIGCDADFNSIGSDTEGRITHQRLKTDLNDKASVGGLCCAGAGRVSSDVHRCIVSHDIDFVTASPYQNRIKLTMEV